jgi:hypothetical protein
MHRFFGLPVNQQNKMNKRQKISPAWHNLPLAVIIRIVDFGEFFVIVQDRRDIKQLFGKRKGVITQIFSNVIFTNRTIPFWSGSKRIKTITTSGWRAIDDIQWLEKWNHVKHINIQTQITHSIWSLLEEEKLQIQTIIEHVKTKRVNSLELVGALSLEGIHDAIHKLTNLKSLTLLFNGRPDHLVGTDSIKVLQSISKLENLNHLRLSALEIFPDSFTLPRSLKVLDLGIITPILSCDSTTPLMELKSLTLRQLYKNSCFQDTVVGLIQAFVEPNRTPTLTSLHIHYNQLDHLHKLVNEVLPKSIKVLSIESRYTRCQFAGLDKCTNQLDTLYLSGYVSEQAVVNLIGNQLALRTLGLGRAVLDQMLVYKLSKLKNLRTLKIEEGYLKRDGLGNARKARIEVEAGVKCNLE